MHSVHRIGVLSDTHMPKRGARLPDAVLRHFEDVELILHAGDLSTLAVLDQLSAYAPVEAVQGNVEVTDKIVIRQNGSLIGDIKAAGIVIDDGAYFKGSIDIVKSPPIKNASPPAKRTSAATSSARLTLAL